jgi:hypothetical protein
MKFVETKSLNNMVRTLGSLLQHVQGRDRGGRKEKGVTNDYKSLLITEKCKNVHKGQSHSVSWENLNA